MNVKRSIWRLIYMKNFLFVAVLLFSVAAQANPFEYFAGSYSVVGSVSIDNWNFPACDLWNLQNTKAVSISADPSNSAAYKLAVDVGNGLQPVESLGDLSCGGECYYRTSSRATPTQEASSSYVPNGFDSPTSRGVIVDQTSNGFELFVADVTYDLNSEGHQRNGYCFYTMMLKKN
jgi:hypothetical protein